MTGPAPARRRGATLFVTVAVILGGTGDIALADGAFPDSSQVLLPAARPDEAILATNFGLIFTSDGGATWEWTCETPLLAQGRLYQLGPGQRIVASSLWGVVRSDDASCSWAGASGDIARSNVTDVFVNQGDPRQVLAIGVDENQAMGLPQLAYASADGGATFGPPIFVATGDSGLLGIESAASDVQTIYLALYTMPAHSALVRSSDGGRTWRTIDLEPLLGPGSVRIIAVDPTDARKIFLRVSQETGGEALAVSMDGGTTFRIPFSTPGTLTSFLRRANGTILAGGLSGDTAVSARSRDGGVTFAPWPEALHLRGLAERDGLLYAAADNLLDGFALATSSDEGVHWQPLLSYAGVTRIKPCTTLACRSACRSNVQLGLWGAAVCADDAPVVDAGGGSDDSGSLASTDAATGSHPPDLSAPRAGGGCSCRAVETGRAGRAADVGAALAVLWGMRRRRRRQRA